METTLRQFSAFVAVARAGSFTGAAARLNSSQSSVSRAVADLESALGMRLLERDTRHVELTSAGRETLQIADGLLDVHAAGLRTLQRFARGESGTVTLATLPSVAAAFLPQVVKLFHDRKPEVEVRMTDGLERFVLERVRAGDADFAISTIGRRVERVERRPLIRDEFVAVLASGHHLGGRDTLRWSDLRHEPFIALGDASSVRRFTDAALAQVGGHDSHTTEAGSIAAVGGLVAAGLGVAALPSLVLPLMGTADVVCRTLRDPVMHRPLDIVLRQRATEGMAVQNFLAVIEEMRPDTSWLPQGVSWA